MCVYSGSHGKRENGTVLFSLVLEPINDGGELAEIMKEINLSYAQYYFATVTLLIKDVRELAIGLWGMYNPLAFIIISITGSRRIQRGYKMAFGCQPDIRPNVLR